MSFLNNTLFARPSIYGGFIDSNICDNIINYFDHFCDEKSAGGVIIDNELVINPKRKNSLDGILDGSIKEQYMDQLSVVVGNFFDAFPHATILNNVGIKEPISIQKYEPYVGGYHQLHCENTVPDTYHRQLVFMTYLNSVDEGGETDFPNQKFKCKPQKGLTLIWPANFDYPHRGLVSNQVKYIVTGWMSCLTELDLKNNV